MPSDLNRTIIRSLWNGYSDSPLVARILASGRTLICPFDRINRHVPAQSRLFDIGCGTGALVNLLAVRGQISEAVGCDISRIAIRSAQQAAIRLGVSGVDFRQASTAKEWPSGPFDVVCLVDVMHHVPPNAQHQFFLDAASRVGHGGMLIYKEIATRPLWRAWANRLHDLVIARQWINYAPVSQALRWAVEVGMTPVEQDAYTVGPYAHELVILRRAA
jgi:2-polyprenyl-3-methyl-5-hydroxy-6-metoxy-1,4-benzoquinol methylase